MRRMMLVLAVACLALFGFAPIAKADVGPTPNVYQQPGVHILSGGQLAKLNAQLSDTDTLVYIVVTDDGTWWPPSDLVMTQGDIFVTFDRTGLKQIVQYDADKATYRKVVTLANAVQPPTATSLQQFVNQAIKAYPPAYTPGFGHPYPTNEGDGGQRFLIAAALVLLGIVVGYLTREIGPRAQRRSSALLRAPKK